MSKSNGYSLEVLPKVIPSAVALGHKLPTFLPASKCYRMTFEDALLRCPVCGMYYVHGAIQEQMIQEDAPI